MRRKTLSIPLIMILILSLFMTGCRGMDQDRAQEIYIRRVEHEIEALIAGISK